jgi:hypothetical protein
VADLPSLFDEPMPEPASGETEMDDGMEALAEEALAAFDRRDAAALASIFRSLTSR